VFYVYDLSSATPTVPVATLTNPDPAEDDEFGFSVAIEGTRVVVAGPNGSEDGIDAGNAYVYDLTSATPSVPVVTSPTPTRRRTTTSAARWLSPGHVW
jgi:hypothetical protein